MIRHRCLRYPRLQGDTLNTRFREDRDRQELRILKVHESKLVRQLLVEISKEECWIDIVGGVVTQESEIRELVQKTARDLVVVTADKPGRRPAICELLKEFLAPRSIAATPHVFRFYQYCMACEA